MRPKHRRGIPSAHNSKSTATIRHTTGNMKKRVVFIINLISGTSSKAEIPALIDSTIDKDKFDYELVVTQYAGHASEIATKAKDDGVDIVVAVGGDGTVNEVARAIVHSRTALGIIPCGSGNGLARHLQIPVNIEKSLHIINDGHIESFDYCTVNDRPFFCTCGMGFDAQVAERFSQEGTRGPLTYLKSAFMEYVKFHHETYRIEINGSTMFEKAFVIACANASQYGNNAYIAPKASMRDGLIDVVVIHPFLPIVAPIVGLKLFTRDFDKDINISTYTTPRLKIFRESPGVMHLDGEPVNMPAELTIACHPQGIRIFCADDVPQSV